MIGGLNAQESYASWAANQLYYTPVSTNTTGIWASPAAQLRFDLVFLEKNPLSFYIGTGYFIYARELSETNQDLSTNILINGIKLEGAIMMYF